jgi:hypothetical protein
MLARRSIARFAALISLTRIAVDQSAMPSIARRFHPAIRFG